MNVNENSIKPASADVAAFVDTALQNPDSEDFGSPFDGVRGLSTLTRQKQSIDLIISDVVSSGQTADIYITQFDFELVGQSTADMFYVLDQGPVSANPSPGLYDSVGSTTAFPTQWGGAGLANSTPVGSLIIHVMTPGQSPYPSTTAGVKGPCTPLKTVRINFDEDVLHDCVRVLGSNYELQDTTNNLDQQGGCFQGAWDVPSKMQQFVTGRNVATSGSNTLYYYQAASMRQSSLPVGSTNELTKLNNSRTGTAKEGFLTMNRLDWSENDPDYGKSINNMYVGTSNNSSIALNGRTPYGVVTSSQLLEYQQASSGALTLAAQGYQSSVVGKAYQTSVEMNMSVIQGVKNTYTATVSRTITTQCFIQPQSQFKAFAKVSHTPVDYAIMQRVQNTMDNTPMFWPNKANGFGTAFKFAKSVWNKAAPIVKTVAPIAKSFLPAPAQMAITAAEKLAKGPTAKLAVDAAKLVADAKKQQKAKDAAKKK